MDGTTLDELDMKILNVLTRNSRVSYNTLGKEIGLTAKSVKARVKKMQSGGIFGNFIARVNPSVLGYSKFWLVYVKKSKRDEKHIQQNLRLLGDILYRENPSEILWRSFWPSRKRLKRNLICWSMR